MTTTVVAFLENAWAQEPVQVTSFTIQSHYNSAPTQPQILQHDQPGHTLQLPSAHTRRWECARLAQNTPPPGSSRAPVWRC